jgi:hypothetical protein
VDARAQGPAMNHKHPTIAQRITRMGARALLLGVLIGAVAWLVAVALIVLFFGVL